MTIDRCPFNGSLTNQSFFLHEETVGKYGVLNESGSGLQGCQLILSKSYANTRYGGDLKYSYGLYFFRESFPSAE
jgi:hypothetical protein